jgi:hypothetical protein
MSAWVAATATLALAGVLAAALLLTPATAVIRKDDQRR